MRDIPGCRCSEAVLASMRICSEPLIAGIPLDVCVPVDGRLLVSVVCPERAGALIGSLRSVFDAGRRSGSWGANRVRVVMGAASVDTVRAELSSAFQALPDLDDCQRLHLVDLNAIPRAAFRAMTSEEVSP